LCLGVRSYNAMHPDKYILGVLTSILGGGMSSRLFIEVRERRGLAYYVRSSNEQYTDVGNFVTQAGVDVGRIDDAVKVILEEFADDEGLVNWIRMAQDQIAFQGLPARICWLGYGERVRAGLKFNELVATGKVRAPIVIGRDHLDSGSVASPNRETEAMKDGSDAISDWPILNALINAVGGATWVSFHHGGGVGMGYSQHAGQVIVADGTPEAAKRLERVLTTDPGMGVVRHADAGYEIAIAAAKRHGIKMPMLK